MSRKIWFRSILSGASALNNFDKITINSKMEAKSVLLFVIWLFLVILPFLILTEAIDIVFKESENRLLSKDKIQLIDEVN